MAKHAPEPLHVAIKRWPDEEARFQLSRPARRPPLSFGLSLDELRELGALAAEAEAILAEEPHRPAYELGDLKLMVANRKRAA